MEKVKKLTFEDIEVGYQLEPIRTLVDQEKINVNAVASLDYNPVHTNPEWCEKYQVFGTTSTVAHGMMTMSQMTSVVTNWAIPHGWYVSGIDGKFTKPVKEGTTLTFTAYVKDKHFVGKGENFIVVSAKAKDDDGEVYGVCVVKVRIG